MSSKNWIVGKCKSTGRVNVYKTVHDVQIEADMGWTTIVARNRESAICKYEELIKQAKKKTV